MTLPKLAEASHGLRYLHSMCIIHNRLKPVSTATIPLLTIDGITQENILIDCDHHPRLADYGLPFGLDIAKRESHRCGDLQYLAPELRDPSSFGLEERTPTKESDSFALGAVIYQVAHCFTFANGDYTRNLGTHRTTTLPRGQTFDQRHCCYRDTTIPPPRF